MHNKMLTLVAAELEYIEYFYQKVFGLSSVYLGVF